MKWHRGWFYVGCFNAALLAFGAIVALFRHVSDQWGASVAANGAMCFAIAIYLRMDEKA